MLTIPPGGSGTWRRACSTTPAVRGNVARGSRVGGPPGNLELMARSADGEVAHLAQQRNRRPGRPEHGAIGEARPEESATSLRALALDAVGRLAAWANSFPTSRRCGATPGPISGAARSPMPTVLISSGSSRCSTRRWPPSLSACCATSATSTWPRPQLRSVAQEFLQHANEEQGHADRIA